MKRGLTFELIAIVTLSIVLPAAFFVWNGRAAMAGKTFAWHTTRYVSFTSCMKDNELCYFAAFPLSENLNKLIQTCHLMRMNLETGVETETGLSTSEEVINRLITCVGDELFVHDQFVIYRIHDDSLEQLGPKRTSTAPYVGLPFTYEGRLTIIAASAEGEFRFHYWNGEEWAAGRRIVLPRTNQVWIDDAKTGRKELLPTTSAQPLLKNRATFPHLEIAHLDTQYLLLVSGHDRDFAAFRLGFEFLDEDLDEGVVSALAPANGTAEATGWRHLPGLTDDPDRKRSQSYATMTASADGFYFVVQDDFRNRSAFPRVFRMLDVDHFEELKSDFQRSPRTEIRNDYVIASPQEEKKYLLSWSQRETNSVDIRRIEGNTIQLPHLSFRDDELKYIRRWERIGLGFVIAWLAHHVVVVLGTDWILSRRQIPPEDSTIQRLYPAGICRRAAAFLVDGLLFMSALTMVTWFSIRNHIDQIAWPNDEELCASLHHVELLVWWYINEGANPLNRLALLTRWLQPFLQSIPNTGEMIWLLLITVIGCYAAKVMMESVYGTTPGKWLLGLRTVRTTMRPVGISRILARDLLFWGDVPLLMTPLPAAVSMILSNKNQRLGDRVADTIVVRLD